MSKTTQLLALILLLSGCSAANNAPLHRPYYNPGGIDFEKDKEFFKSYQKLSATRKKLCEKSSIIERNEEDIAVYDNGLVPGSILIETQTSKIAKDNALMKKLNHKIKSHKDKEWFQENCVENEDLPEDIKVLIGEKCTSILKNTDLNVVEIIGAQPQTQLEESGDLKFVTDDKDVNNKTQEPKKSTCELEEVDLKGENSDGRKQSKLKKGLPRIKTINRYEAQHPEKPITLNDVVEQEFEILESENSKAPEVNTAPRNDFEASSEKSAELRKKAGAQKIKISKNTSMISKRENAKKKCQAKMLSKKQRATEHHQMTQEKPNQSKFSETIITDDDTTHRDSSDNKSVKKIIEEINKDSTENSDGYGILRTPESSCQENF